MKMRDALEKLDTWVATSVFGPLVLLLAGTTRQSPFAVSRFFWFIAALDALAWADNAMTIILFGGMSIYMMCAAALRADRPTRSFLKFRLLALLLLFVLALRGVVTGQWVGTEFWIFVGIAQYAAMIGASSATPPKSRSG